MIRYVLLIASSIALMAASCESEPQKTLPKNYTADELIEANKRKVGTETDIISRYIEKNGWEMEKTPTGLRYDIYEKGDGEQAKTDMIASVSYSVYLLDSALIAKTELGKTEQFRIGEANVVAGLHEAVALLQVGDRARIIIPSYLAYGLTGNQINVPPNAALFYDITLVDLY